MKKKNNLDIIAGVVAIGVILVVAGIILGRQSAKDTTALTADMTEGPSVEVLPEEGEGSQTEKPETEEASEAQQAPAGQEETASAGKAEDPDKDRKAQTDADEAKEDGAKAPSADEKETEQAEKEPADQDPKAPAKDTVTQKVSKKTKEQRDAQMAELYDYWSREDMAAVEDVIRLQRNVELSAELEGSDVFYYYGDTTGQGVPNGIGLAVYADNQFYFGEWLNGVRSGQGKWIKVYYYDKDTKEEDRLYLEHTYSGQWANDLPEGEGQEHFDIDASRITDNLGCVQNVIGVFKEGLYDGEMYIIRLYEDGSVREWEGTANYGVWKPLGKVNRKGEYPINVRKVDEDNYIWCRPAENVNHGIEGIIAAK